MRGASPCVPADDASRHSRQEPADLGRLPYATSSCRYPPLIQPSRDLPQRRSAPGSQFGQRAGEIPRPILSSRPVHRGTTSSPCAAILQVNGNPGRQLVRLAGGMDGGHPKRQPSSIAGGEGLLVGVLESTLENLNRFS